MTEQPKRESRHKLGNFILVKPRGRKKGRPMSPASDPREAVPTTPGGAGLSVGTSLGEVASDAVKRTGHKFAGMKCQAPKGQGICGATISAHNPNGKIPVCQPCAARLRDEARRRGESPDIEKVWKKIEAQRKKQTLENLAARPSGVQEVATPSAAPAQPEPPVQSSTGSTG